MPIRRVRTVMTGLPGSPFLSTHYFQHVEATSATATLSHVTAFWANIRAIIANDLTITLEPIVDVLDETTGDLIESLTGVPVPTSGDNTGALAPAATQGLLRMKTGAVAGGRRVQGHLFIPGVTNPSSGEGLNPQSGYIGVVNAGGQDLIDDTTSDGPWVVWSRKNGVAPAVTQATCWNQWSVLRSRRD